MHHASSDVTGSQGVESQSHHLMHDVYLQFPVYFTTIVGVKSTNLNLLQEKTNEFKLNENLDRDSLKELKHVFVRS